MRKLYFIVLFLISIHQLVDASSLHVKYLPGFQGPLPFELETGYVSVGDSGDVELFYYFVKSERNPKNDPLMFWLSGGPGCSSVNGFLFANGPLEFKGDVYNGTLPPLKLTSFSWSKVANIVYLESPVGAGYSYAKTPHAFKTSDTTQIHQIGQFIRSWLVDHPEFISNKFYVGGDSYAGIIVPGAVQQISLANKKGLKPRINIQGYVLGNPVTDLHIISNLRVSFAHRMGLLSDVLFESLKRSCGGIFFNIDPNNAKCSNDFKTYEKSISEIYIEQILLPNCKVDYVLPDIPQAFPNSRRQAQKKLSGNESSSLPPRSCFTYKYFLSAFWANDKKVRRALGVKKDVGKWSRCNIQNIPYTFDIDSAIPYHVNASLKGFRSLIYSGDHDLLVPYTSAQELIRVLNYSIVDDWRPWMMSSNRVAGYTSTYANKMTFATIKGGGHTAEYNPKQCSLMFRRWIDGKPL